MKHIQKLVLVPIEKWEEIGDKILCCKRSFSENSSSDESTSSPESNFSNDYPESEESTRFRKDREVEPISDVSLSFSEEEK